MLREASRRRTVSVSKGKCYETPAYGIGIVLGLCVVGVMAVSAKDKDSDDKVGDTAFSAYDGSQSWPTGQRRRGEQGLRGADLHRIAGQEIQGDRPHLRQAQDSGFDAMSRAFDEGLGSEKHRMRNVANQAKDHGADAVIVVEDEDVFKAFNLTKKEVRRVVAVVQVQAQHRPRREVLTGWVGDGRWSHPS
jgi:hypothetical protein